MKISNIKSAVVKFAGKTGFKIKKFSPEILLVVGIGGIVTSTVLACKATLKVDTVLDDAQEKITKIKDARETFAGEINEHNEETYSEKDYKKDMTITYVQTGLQFVKLYAPAILVGSFAIGCLIGSHNILKKRNLALAAAYKGLDAAFKNYRKRVVDEYGADKDRDYRYGITEEKVKTTTVGKNGKEKVTEETVATLDPTQYSQYARIFDETCTQWDKNSEYNLTFLQCQQNYANQLLHSRGHVFLNEVYDALGIPRTQSGQVVGWIDGDDGDNFIDFGVFDPSKEGARRFVNGYERSIILDFNVDGVVYDLI